MARWYEAMLADYEEHLAEHSGTRNRLRFVVRRHLTSIDRNPALCRVFFREIRGAEDYRGSAIYPPQPALHAFRSWRFLRDGVAQGEIRRRREDDPHPRHDLWRRRAPYLEPRLGTRRARRRRRSPTNLVDTILGGIALPASESLLDRLGNLVERLEQRLDGAERG